MSTVAFGIDIGGTGMKGAPVDLERGDLADERYRLETPQPSTPQAVASVVAELLEHFDWRGPVGCSFPAVIERGVVRTAANVSDDWLGTDIEHLLEQATGHPTVAMNDADAAGLAEAHFGAARDADGLVIVTTLGTGIGSALVYDNVLLPNTELGHLVIDGEAAELRASSNARKRDELSWQQWGERLTRYYRYVEELLWPELFVLGGGVSKKSDQWLRYVECRTPVVPAQLQNQAGIVGAAMLAHQRATG